MEIRKYFRSDFVICVYCKISILFYGIRLVVNSGTYYLLEYKRYNIVNNFTRVTE